MSKNPKGTELQDMLYPDLLQAGYRFAVHRGIWHADAEDVAITSLAKFHRVYGEKLYVIDSPQALYFYVLRSCIADVARKRRPVPPKPEPAKSPNPSTKLDLESLLATLPVDQQEVLLLIYFEGFTYPEAAKATGRSIDSLKNLRKKALQFLRAQFGETKETLS